LIYQEPVLAVLPISHPLAKKRTIRLRDLADEPFVLYFRDGATEMFDTIIGVCKKAGLSPRIVDGPGLMQTVLTMVNRSKASLLCLRAFGSSVPQCNFPQTSSRSNTTRSGNGCSARKAVGRSDGLPAIDQETATNSSQNRSLPFRRLRSVGAPQKFTEVADVRRAGVANDEIPQASFCPRFGIEGQIPTKRGSRIQPA